MGNGRFLRTVSGTVIHIPKRVVEEQDLRVGDYLTIVIRRVYDINMDELPMEPLEFTGRFNGGNGVTIPVKIRGTLDLKRGTKVAIEIKQIKKVEI
jgi:bifunctional DNA-binding transcriptional regulator/antitoxin component of YhaV-PrlF toxin-antitoxin module